MTVLLLAVSGCRNVTDEPASTSPEPAPERYTAYIRLEGVVVGGAIKVNGSQETMFPGWIAVEVDTAGKAVRRYVISLSTNILGTDGSVFVIEQGQDVPVKIYFDRGGPVATGTARVERRT